MNCPKCGIDIPQGSAFCPSCGTPTAGQDSATVAISVQAMEDPLLTAVKDALSQYYVVDKELGRGGMAVVYQGKEKGLEREVAIKVLPPEMALQGGTAERFRREARLAASLEHQNIIPVYRVGEEKNLIYMAMKFVRGLPLDEILEAQGALPVPVVTRILHAAASGLAHAHDHNVVHRDIKGANILIELDGRPLVSDFGIARAMTENSLTASGMVIGTPNFMSPEQCGGSKVGPQSDQYSLGILGFQMLTGQLPFEADSIMGIIQHHYMTPPPDITQVRDDVQPELLAVIYKALSKKPDDRFASTHDMVDALEAVPQTAEQRRESLAMLKQLATGEKVTSVRTGTLPPLSLTAAISGQRPSQAHPSIAGGATEVIGKKPGAKTRLERPAVKPKGKGGLIAALLVVLGLAGGGGAYWQFVLNKPASGVDTTATVLPAALPAAQPAAQTAAPAPADPAPGTPAAQPASRPSRPADTRRPATTPAPTPEPTPPPVVQPARPTGTGMIIISVPNCLTADIHIDGQRVGAGRYSGSFAAGSHSIRVTPPDGSAPYSTSIDLAPGESKRIPVGSVNCGTQ